jgi:uncharacterized protein YndB with AHSA1/START domain
VATNKRFMPVPPQAVWDVLSDPGDYGYWVVGSKVIRDADADWPAPGSKFHHTIGVGPIKLSDHTVALEAERPHRMVLRAKGRPIGTARVTLTMTPRDGGTVVHMVENPDGVYRPLALNPLVHLLTIARNSESLMRLEELALRKAGA